MDNDAKMMVAVGALGLLLAYAMSGKNKTVVKPPPQTDPATRRDPLYDRPFGYDEPEPNPLPTEPPEPAELPEPLVATQSTVVVGRTEPIGPVTGADGNVMQTTGVNPVNGHATIDPSAVVTTATEVSLSTQPPLQTSSLPGPAATYASLMSTAGCAAAGYTNGDLTHWNCPTSALNSWAFNSSEGPYQVTKVASASTGKAAYSREDSARQMPVYFVQWLPQNTQITPPAPTTTTTTTRPVVMLDMNAIG